LKFDVKLEGDNHDRMREKYEAEVKLLADESKT